MYRHLRKAMANLLPSGNGRLENLPAEHPAGSEYIGPCKDNGKENGNYCSSILGISCARDLLRILRHKVYGMNSSLASNCETANSFRSSRHTRVPLLKCWDACRGHVTGS